MSEVQGSKELALYSSMVVSFLMHEITGLLAEKAEVMVSVGKYSKKDAHIIIKKALVQSLKYLKEQDGVYPEGMGRQTRGIELFLEQVVAPLHEAAASKE